jgi:hypothetical protein
LVKTFEHRIGRRLCEKPVVGRRPLVVGSTAQLSLRTSNFGCCEEIQQTG